MKNQEIYNRAARHLLRQKKVSKDESSFACMYRGPKGLRCAVGALITNDEYDERMEHRTAEQLYLKFRNLKIFKDLDYGLASRICLLTSLQLIHDQEHTCAWRNKLIKLAEEFDLKPIK